jgi:hypothetical protein
MKLHPLFLALALVVSPIHAAPFDPDKLDLGIPPVMLHALIRSTAAKIEAERAETKGLVARVEELLAIPEPETQDHADDRAAWLASEMTLASYNVSANAALGGVRGHLFDGTDTGRMQLYRDLEKQQTQDADEVRRWLQMRKAAEGLKWKDESQLCHERSVGAARALVSREPKNATAHALLAFALDWRDDSSAETLAALQKALQIDSKQPLAQVMLLERKIEKAQESAAFRRGADLGEKSPENVLRQLFDHPLSAEELAAFEREMAPLIKEADKVLNNAAEQRDFAVFMLSAQLGLRLRNALNEAAASQKRPPDISFEEFAGRLGMESAQFVFSFFKKPAHVMKAVELAGDDAEGIGTVALLAFTSRYVVAMSQKRELDETDTALINGMLRKLVQLAGADESANAARACEAVSIIGLMQVLSGRPPSHPQMLLRAVQLDPFRHRNLNFLVALAMTLKENRYATAAAVVEMQLAVLPNPLTRREAAAVATRLREWDRALQHLDAAEKESPDDRAILAQRVATLLRQSQSQATIKKTGLLLGAFNADNLVEKTAGMPQDERGDFFDNFILHQLIARRRDSAEAALRAASEARVYDQSRQARVREWMEK